MATCRGETTVNNTTTHDAVTILSSAALHESPIACRTKPNSRATWSGATAVNTTIYIAGGWCQCRARRCMNRRSRVEQEEQQNDDMMLLSAALHASPTAIEKQQHDMERRNSRQQYTDQRTLAMEPFLPSCLVVFITRWTCSADSTFLRAPRAGHRLHN